MIPALKMIGEAGLFLKGKDSVAKGTLIARPTAVKLAPLNFGKTNVSDVSALLLLLLLLLFRNCFLPPLTRSGRT